MRHCFEGPLTQVESLLKTKCLDCYWSYSFLSANALRPIFVLPVSLSAVLPTNTRSENTRLSILTVYAKKLVSEKC